MYSQSQRSVCRLVDDVSAVTSLSHRVAAAAVGLTVGRLVVYRLPVDLLINLGGPPGQLVASQLTSGLQ